MAKTLQEALQETQAAGLQSARAGLPVAGEQAKTIRGVLQAKTGRVGGAPAGPAESAVGERVALSQAGLGLDAAAGEQAVQAAQLGQAEREQDRKVADRRADILLADQQTQSRLRQEERRLVGELNRASSEIGSQERRAAADQLGVVLALQDRKYTDRLELEGEKRRLTDRLSFEAALEEEILGEQAKLSREFFEKRSVLDISDREFELWLRKMDGEEARRVARAAQADADKQRMIQGGTEAVKAGGAVYGQYQTDQNNKDYATYVKTAPEGKAMTQSEWNARGGAEYNNQARPPVSASGTQPTGRKRTDIQTSPGAVGAGNMRSGS